MPFTIIIGIVGEVTVITTMHATHSQHYKFRLFMSFCNPTVVCAVCVLRGVCCGGYVVGGVYCSAAAKSGSGLHLFPANYSFPSPSRAVSHQ